jgi:hypothetical protein
MFFDRIGRVFFRILNSGSSDLDWFLSDLDLDSTFGFSSDLDWFLSDLDLDSTLGFSSDWISYFFRFGYIKSIQNGLFLKAREHSILS